MIIYTAIITIFIALIASVVIVCVELKSIRRWIDRIDEDQQKFYTLRSRVIGLERRNEAIDKAKELEEYHKEKLKGMCRGIYNPIEE